MNRIARIVIITCALVSLGLPLAACSDFDPQGIVDSIFAGQKKPLPGDRKPLFPGGTPGVQQGVPPDLIKGYQPPPDTPADAQAAPEPAKPKAKPKPKVAAPATATAAAPAPAQPRPVQTQAQPWPGQQSTGQTAAPAWPDPPVMR